MVAFKNFIKVATIFKGGTITPLWFEWNNQKYRIDRVVYRWEEKKGRAQILYFAVMSDGDLYNLRLDMENLVWEICNSEI